MRSFLFVAAAAGSLMLGIGVAHAGTLQSATLQITGLGQVFNIDASGATGSSTASTASLDAGQVFQTTVPFAGSVPAPATTASLHLYRNGAVAATPGAVSITSPITGALVVHANSKQLTLSAVVIRAGFSGTFWQSNGLYTSHTLIASGWHAGQAQVASSGITHVSFPNAAGTGVSTAAQTHLTATGSFNLTPGGGGTVTLVTITHVMTPSGLTYSYGGSNWASPTYLKLTYAAPEPGTLLLLAAGAAGLVLAGHRKEPVRSRRSEGA